MNLAVVGSRNLPEDRYWVVRYEVQVVGERYGWDLTLVSGGARGADTMAAKAADDFGVPIIVHRAEWQRYGRRAGFLRNQQIIADADALLAFFYRERSAGTQHSIDLARAKGIPVRVFVDGNEVAE